MPTFRVRVTQVYRVDKSITVNVEADTAEGAIETCQSGEAPCFSLPGWQEYWELENETVELP